MHEDLEYERFISQKRANYKEMHRGTAKSKGVLLEFLQAYTLTEMRKVLWGEKKKMTKRRVRGSINDNSDD